MCPRLVMYKLADSKCSYATLALAARPCCRARILAATSRPRLRLHQNADPVAWAAVGFNRNNLSNIEYIYYRLSLGYFIYFRFLVIRKTKDIQNEEQMRVRYYLIAINNVKLQINIDDSCIKYLGLYKQHNLKNTVYCIIGIIVYSIHIFMYIFIIVLYVIYIELFHM